MTGSRGWLDGVVLGRHLERIGPSILSHGVCRGADLLADEWARDHGVPSVPYPADWRPSGRFDRAAGRKRNRWMFDDFGPELVVAFKDDFDFTLTRGGTEHMVTVALAGGVNVQVINSLDEVTHLYARTQLPFS